MKRFILAGFIVGIVFLINSQAALAQEELTGFRPYFVKRGDTFFKIAPRPAWIIIKKVNRIDKLYYGRTILVPTNIELAYKYCPMPKILLAYKKTKKAIVVNVHPRAQCFGAYEFGRLMRWGPISSGRKGEKRIKTPTGSYEVMGKEKKHWSSIDGSPMPYSLHIYRGVFIHEQQLPGYPDSHGCIRLLKEDAKWLFYWTPLKAKVKVISQPLSAQNDEDDDDGEPQGSYLANK